MIGSIEIPQAFIDQMASWFCHGFDDPYRNPRLEKSKGLYQLASLVQRGVIVELGAYHGNGAIALAAGSQGKRIVYTIDDFDRHVDWMGNAPDKTDLALLKLHIDESGLPISWINSTAEKAVENWTLPIGLVHWDLGTNGIQTDFERWSKHLIAGGMFVMHDTDDRHFHSDEIEQRALGLGWTLGPEARTLYTVVKP